PPRRVLSPRSTAEKPIWLARAKLNIAESCFRPDPRRTAIVSATEMAPTPVGMTYGELRVLANRVANGLEASGVARGGRVALFMPMTPESVAIYLGVVLSGRCVVGIADASAPEEFAKRARIGDADLVFTIESYVRGGKTHRIYEKLVSAGGPRAVVLAGDRKTPTLSRP